MGIETSFFFRSWINFNWGAWLVLCISYFARESVMPLFLNDFFFPFSVCMCLLIHLSTPASACCGIIPTAEAAVSAFLTSKCCITGQNFMDSPVFFFWLLMCVSPRVRMSHRINLESVLADTYNLLKWYVFLSWQEHNYIGFLTILFQMRRSRWLQMLRNSSKKRGNWYVLAFHMLTANS